MSTSELLLMVSEVKDPQVKVLLLTLFERVKELEGEINNLKRTSKHNDAQTIGGLSIG